MAELAGSPWRAIIETMFHVITKSRESVPFVLNPMQQLLDARLSGRDLGPKARQLGFSTYMIARNVAKCLTLPNQRCVLISHEEAATKRLLATAHMFINSLRSPSPGVKVEADTARATQAELVFNKTNSWFYIGTAGQRAFGRGDTITALHCSEYAWWPNPEELLKGLLGSVPAPPWGEVCIESTGHGTGNDFETRCRRAARGESEWALHFFPWQEAAEYSLDLAPDAQATLLANLRPELNEAELISAFNLTAGQLAWRRMQLDNFNNDLAWFNQEFPMTLDECFQTTGGMVFDRVKFQPTIAWKTQRTFGGGTGELVDHPRANLTYVVGVDTGAGVENDASVIQVGCVETNEQVYRWHNFRTPPDELGKGILSTIAQRYNNALIVVESNNHGLTTLAALKAAGHDPSRIFKRRSIDVTRPERGIADWGYATTSKTKPLAVGRLRELLAQDFVIHDELTRYELAAFIETDTGKLEAQSGAHDDFVMALVMMAAGWLKGALQAGSAVDLTAPATSRWIGSTANAVNIDDVFEHVGKPTRNLTLVRPRQQIGGY